MRDKLFLMAFLLVLGAAWGVTQPLTKIAVSEDYRQFGLIFWQVSISTVILGVICAVRKTALPLGVRHIWAYVVIALIGTVLPNGASYQAMVHLPAGIVSILLSLIPMIAFPMALALGNEHFRLRRLIGLTLGLIAVLLITLPEASLPERAMLAVIPLALVAPCLYAFEGNYVARWGTAGLDPFQVMFGASIVGVFVTLPLAIWKGQFLVLQIPMGAPDVAILVSSVVHALTYTGYVWLIGRAGAVFAVQVSYPVTAFGLLWSMLLLGERYSVWVWAAFVVMIVGLTLVQPRPRLLDSAPTLRDTA
ncbi:DMT family transporter [uncultured Litoreibacter sp.]|uniref:DMT family transporter n=1 Tax=uncultured Litoreibacter sp. TaxID=1392394 RepID=UPI0026348C44|nr:DMT family transporter [uncultured Litoreibacter sp.]